MKNAHNPNYRSQVGCFGTTYGGCSEIIVRNTGAAGWPLNTALSWLHNWWVGSTPHRNAMLDERYTHAGYGFARSPSGVPYVVAVLAQKY